ncbi:MAG: hypothetical protein A3K19_28510 [Lentisphaerae bacterium RIFOXYB12_FULL_65_16]|nr:MAG: hypothetical protein A3K18_19760 [Lentisphaerae bacterium RIFOXYA12_64_32]OGV85529.1 MAG: hypothetical protein A3K19_28510 [Lentisphaerae bacterium RIFOXYB12_FULL_65_16]
MRSAIRKFIHHPVTDAVVALLIVASVGLIVLESRATEPERRQWLGLAGQVVNLIFIVELALRSVAARSQREFLRDFWVDIVSVLPFSSSFRALRIVRLLRLVRLGYYLARRGRRFMSAVSRNPAENSVVTTALAVVLVFGVVGMRIAEEPEVKGIGDAVWFTLFTLMGAQPAPIVPETLLGRVVCMVIILSGFTLFAFLTGTVSAFMVERMRGGLDVHLDLETLRDHYVICGWNRAAVSILRGLRGNAETRPVPIVVAAELEEEPDLHDVDMRRESVCFVRDDFSSTEVLRRIRVDHARRAILLADKSKPRSDQDRDARTILAALTIEKMRSGPGLGHTPIYTCVELLRRDAYKTRLLEQAGVEDIIETDEYMANLIAHTVRAYGLAQVLTELLTSGTGSEFVRRAVPSARAGLTFVEALRVWKAESNEIPLAWIRKTETGADGECVVNPAPGQVLAAGDDLILVSIPCDATRGGPPIRSVLTSGSARTAALPERPALDSLSGHIVICGWNRAAPKIIRQFRENTQTRRVPVVVIAEPAKPPEEYRVDATDPLTFYLSGDSTSIAVLEQARVGVARAAVLLADKSLPDRSDQDRDARTILTALTIEKMNPALQTCAELLARDEEKVQLLQLSNVEDIVVADEYVGNLIAQATRANGLVHVLDELLTSNTDNEFRKIAVPDDLAGVPFAEALVRHKQRRDEIILAIESTTAPGLPDLDSARRYYLVNPPATWPLRAEDRLFVITRDQSGTEVAG